MKKIVIGSVCLVTGVIEVIGILICGAIYLPHLNAWSTSYSSKLFFIIFAGKSKFNDGVNGLGLGVFFVFGLVLSIIGIIILFKEYISENKA